MALNPENSMVTTLLGLSLLAPAQATQPEAIIGKPAPEFTLSDLDGEQVKLSDLKGKTVVLEWFNPGCPYVKYAHAGGPLESLAEERANDEIVWLAINSSAPGKQGHGIEVNKSAAESWSMNHPILIDEDGTVGRLYNARTTPQMFVVDGDGTLVYGGALDNSPLGKSQGELTNYVVAALDEVASDGRVAIDETKPYGCSVKY